MRRRKGQGGMTGGGRLPVYVLVGADEGALLQREQALVQKLLPPDADPTVAVLPVDVEAEGIERALEAFELGTLFGGPTVVVGRRVHFLTARGGSRRGGKAAEGERERLERFLADLAASGEAGTAPTGGGSPLAGRALVLTVPADGLDGRLKVVERLKALGTIETVSAPTADERLRQVQEALRARGLSLPPERLEALVARLPEEPAAATLELEKWLLYTEATGAPPDEEAEGWLLSEAPEGDAFRLIDALMAGEGAQARAILARLKGDEEPLRLIGLMLQQVRLMLIVREAAEAPEALAATLGVHPFAVKMARRRSARVAPERLTAIFRELAWIDRGLKTGAVPRESAVERAVLAFFLPA
ncbi:DNA polymerase III subunit delta [Hydrogenibacillus schlegelii]|nr:hypothetical protein [Hydrogenibacillus schlegelii]